MKKNYKNYFYRYLLLQENITKSDENRRTSKKQDNLIVKEKLHEIKNEGKDEVKDDIKNEVEDGVKDETQVTKRTLSESENNDEKNNKKFKKVSSKK